MARRSILRTLLRLMPVSIVLRTIEGVLPLCLAYWFGAGDATDVYYFVAAVFTFAGSLVFSIHQDSALVPILAEERLAQREGVPRLRGSVLAHTWLVGGGLAFVLGAGALVWLRLRYDDSRFGIAAAMVAPFCLYLVVMSSRTFFGSLLVAEQQFLAPPLATASGMVLNVGILALFHRSVTTIPIAALAGETLATVLLAIHSIRGLGLKVELCLERPPALRTFARLAASQVGGSAVTRINPIVDQLMAGFAAIAGGGTVLRYAGDMALLPTSFLQATLLPVLLSHLAEDFAHKDLTRLRRTVGRALASVCLILIVASVVLVLIRRPLLRLVFLHGQMDAAGVQQMIDLFPYSVAGLAPFGALLVLARAHVATKNSGILLSMGIFNAGSNVLFNLLLFSALGLRGIALGTSLVHLAVAVVFWFRLRARFREL